MVFKENKEITSELVKRFEAGLKRNFSNDVKGVEAVYNDRNVGLRIRVKNHGGKELATIKVGNFVYDKWGVYEKPSTIRFNKAMDIRFVTFVTSYANRFENLFKALVEKEKNGNNSDNYLVKEFE